MTELRVLSRVLIVDDSKILLVRNRDADFWYPPGGGWEYDRESIVECAAREVREETGYDVTIDRMLWLQEFHAGEQVFFETFWLASLHKSNTQNESTLDQHVDLDPNGAVVEARWYTQDDLVDLKVFPKRIKTFKNYIEQQSGIENPFIGTFE